MLGLYDRIVSKKLLVRRINVTANRVVSEAEAKKATAKEGQISIFDIDPAVETGKEENESQTLENEKKLQKAVIDIKKKFGKNAILKGMNLQEGATAKDRNRQIGGHKA